MNKLTPSIYCENIKKTNKKCIITIKTISTGIFIMDIENIYSFRELNNVCQLFKMYVYYSKLYNTRFNFKNENRLLSINPYIENNNRIYNLYNNIFNRYNILHSLNDNMKKSYFIYNIYIIL